jgi:hypothetical protein
MDNNKEVILGGFSTVEELKMLLRPFTEDCLILSEEGLLTLQLSYVSVKSGYAYLKINRFNVEDTKQKT